MIKLPIYNKKTKRPLIIFPQATRTLSMKKYHLKKVFQKFMKN